MLVKVTGQQEDTPILIKTKSEANRKFEEIYNQQGDRISNQKSLTKKMLRPGGFNSEFYKIHKEKQKLIL